MKLILANDAHLAHKGPATRTDDYQEAIFGKLEQIKRLAVAINATAVLLAGDVFHHKVKVAYGTIYRLMEWCFSLQAQGVEVLAIAGNHDEQHDRLDSIPSQPLGLLFKCGAMKNVAEHPRHYNTTPAVAVYGLAYPDAEDPAGFERFRDLKLSEQGAVLMAHCFATAEGGSSFGEHVHRYADLLDLPFNVFHFGHDHSDHGVTTLDGKHFVNIGALARGSLSEPEINRVVKVAIVEFEPHKVHVQQVKLQTAPFMSIFDLQLHEQKVRSKHDIELFVADLSARLDATGPVDLRTRLDTLSLTAEVKRRVLDYLTSAEAKLD